MFLISGIKHILIGSNFISITKQNNKKWKNIKIKSVEIVVEHIVSGLSLININKDIEKEYSNIDKIIIDTIKYKIRPLINIDGGDIEYIKYNEKTVYIKLYGSCIGCSNKNITLKKFIHKTIQKNISEIKYTKIIK